MITVETVKFGKIEIEDPRVVSMQEGGILGFSQLRDFVLLIPDKKKTFWWLQSVEDGNVAFIVTDPFNVCPDYELDIPTKDMELLNIESQEDIVVLAIVSVSRTPSLRITVNLRAPIIINAKDMIARQVVLEREDYDIRHEIKSMQESTGQEFTSRINAVCAC